MKIVNFKYGINMPFFENKANIMIIENQKAYTDILQNLHTQSYGGNGDFVLSEGENQLKIEEEMELVIDPFSLEFNSRKILGKLYKQLEELGEDYFVTKEQINTNIVNLLDQIASASIYENIVYNLNLEWKELFKLYQLKIDKEYASLLEKLIEYIRIMSYICRCRILCLVNIKSYLNDSEIQQLYEMAFYNKMYLLLIEDFEKESKDCEQVYMRDKDLRLLQK